MYKYVGPACTLISGGTSLRTTLVLPSRRSVLKPLKLPRKPNPSFFFFSSLYLGAAFAFSRWLIGFLRVVSFCIVEGFNVSVQSRCRGLAFPLVMRMTPSYTNAQDLILSSCFIFFPLTSLSHSRWSSRTSSPSYSPLRPCYLFYFFFNHLLVCLFNSFLLENLIA